MFIHIIKLLRPKHWVKNIFVFVALIFAEELLLGESFILSLLAFVAFCLVASGMYVINDIVDAKSDRLHPVKKNRPIASGKVSQSMGFAIASVCIVGGFSIGYLVNSAFLALLMLYMLMITAYSFWLKKKAIIDVLIVALGFVFRAVGGALAIGVEFSPWLIVSTLFLALFLILGKRRHELGLLQEESHNHRASLQSYTTVMLDQLLSISAAASLMSYSLYTLNPLTIERFGTDKLYMTLPIVLYGFFRYFYLIYKKDLGGDPAYTLLSDKPILVTVFLWTATVIAIIYGTVA